MINILKTTGYVRPLDRLGRIVIPSELRRDFDITKGQDIEILTMPNCIIFQKATKRCYFCDTTENVGQFRNVNICEGCRVEIGNLVKQEN